LRIMLTSSAKTSCVQDDANRYVCGKFSGAVGSYAAQTLYGVDDELEKKVMDRLGVGAADISNQVVPRENLARILSDIAIYAASIEQIAKEIRNLQRTEIAEVSESFGEKQVGSSTMAQKRNPIDTENICSNVKIIRSCLGPALENIALEHERDLTNSAAERSLLPTAFVLADEITSRMTRVLKNLVVNEQNMRRNLQLTNGTIMAEAVITELVKRGMPRQDAHEFLRNASSTAASENKQLADVLKADSTYIKPEELPQLLDPANYTGLCVAKTENIIRKWRNAGS
jgi:adenylosuccinate lyase